MVVLFRCVASKHTHIISRVIMTSHNNHNNNNQNSAAAVSSQSPSSSATSSSSAQLYGDHVGRSNNHSAIAGGQQQQQHPVAAGTANGTSTSGLFGKQPISAQMSSFCVKLLTFNHYISLLNLNTFSLDFQSSYHIKSWIWFIFTESFFLHLHIVLWRVLKSITFTCKIILESCSDRSCWIPVLVPYKHKCITLYVCML